MTDLHLPGDRELALRVAELAACLTARGWTMAAAESCSGGWIAKCCTDRAGSSGWFERGFVTYSNAAKMDMLGVRRQTLEEQGAVSGQTAREMSEGARIRSGADIAVAVTGIAGPTGGTQDKPAGTVWFGWSVAGGTETEKKLFAGDREQVRRQTVAHALDGLIARSKP